MAPTRAGMGEHAEPLRFMGLVFTEGAPGTTGHLYVCPPSQGPRATEPGNSRAVCSRGSSRTRSQDVLSENQEEEKRARLSGERRLFRLESRVLAVAWEP